MARRGGRSSHRSDPGALGWRRLRGVRPTTSRFARWLRRAVRSVLLRGHRALLRGVETRMERAVRARVKGCARAPGIEQPAPAELRRADSPSQSTPVRLATSDFVVAHGEQHAASAAQRGSPRPRQPRLIAACPRQAGGRRTLPDVPPARPHPAREDQERTARHPNRRGGVRSRAQPASIRVPDAARSRSRRRPIFHCW